jgi:hypothetical protein
VSGIVEDWKFGLFVLLGIGCLSAVSLISDREHEPPLSRSEVGEDLAPDLAQDPPQPGR